MSLGELLGGKKSRALTARPSAPPQVSVINGTSPFAHDYDLAHIVAAYQERNGESWTPRSQTAQAEGTVKTNHWDTVRDENRKPSGGSGMGIPELVLCPLSSEPRHFPQVTSPTAQHISSHAPYLSSHRLGCFPLLNVYLSLIELSLTIHLRKKPGTICCPHLPDSDG